MEDFIKKLGFESFEESLNLVAKVDLSTPEKLESFINWKEEDGTKEGLLKLDSIEK